MQRLAVEGCLGEVSVGGGQGTHKAPGSLGEAAAGPGAPLTCVLEAKKGELGSPRDFSFTNEG